MYNVCCADFDHDDDIDIAATGHTHDRAVVLFNQTNSLTDVSENPNDNTQCTSFDLYQNYPNPFNPVTEIAFTLPTTSDASIDIYNILGQKIETLVNDRLKAGRHLYRWNASAYPSGVYFAVLKAGSFSDAKKMILLK
ncbi:MAG: T9SS type A sorting domain-containing protein [candidate division Zixibacteria bacterium]|nr:T9SS type A sorting domain-containing protein [candidate division Zixibacteria bacterium]